jgi:hypothetical protein
VDDRADRGQEAKLAAPLRSSKGQGPGMADQGRDSALDHMVVVVFENRSLDNVLGRLYGPEDGKTFDGVIGKDLTNPPPPRTTADEGGADHGGWNSWSGTPRTLQGPATTARPSPGASP